MAVTVTDVLAIHDLALAELRKHPNLDVYDGAPPDDIRLDADGLAHQHVCLWLGVGDSGQLPPSLCDDRDGTRYTIRLTAVGGDQRRAFTAAAAARRALTGLRVRADARRTREVPLAATLLEDSGVHPRRWFLPMEWEAWLP